MRNKKQRGYVSRFFSISLSELSAQHSSELREIDAQQSVGTSSLDKTSRQAQLNLGALMQFERMRELDTSFKRRTKCRGEFRKI